MRNYFLTGATGLLGNCILRQLLEMEQAKVRVLSRAGGVPALDGLDIEVIKGDLSDEVVLADVIGSSDVVIHSAAYIHIGWDRLSESRSVNVEGTRRIAQACLDKGARLIYVSTVDTLPAATNFEAPITESGLSASGRTGIAKTACSYVVSKTEAEAVVREMMNRGLDAVIVHPGFMLGPFDWKPSSGRMMLEVYKAPLPIAPPGGCSLCDARDVAKAIVYSVDRGRAGQNYILAGENLTYQQLWQQMLDATQRRRRVGRMGNSIRLVGKAIDACNRWLPIREGDVNGAAIEMGCLNHYYESALAEKELGYQRQPSSETLHDAWHWLQQHHL